MADYLIRGTEDPRTKLPHSDEIFHQYVKTSKMGTMTGKKDSGMPIIVATKKGVGDGDTTRFHFIPQYKTKMIRGQNPTIMGNESKLDEFYMDIKVGQDATALASKGKLTTLRLIWDFRTEAKKQMTTRFGMHHDEQLALALSGFLKNGWDPIDDEANGQTVFGDYRLIVSNGTDFNTPDPTTASSTNFLLGDVVAADKMNIQIMNSLQALAKSGKYPIAPVKMSNGEEYYILVVHPHVGIDIRNTKEWQTRAMSIIQAGINPEKDPIATGALGVYNRIILKEDDYIMTHQNQTTKSLVARNLLLGANAVGTMYAQTMNYSEEWADHKRYLSVACDEIAGRGKVTYNGVDIGVAQVVTSANLK